MSNKGNHLSTGKEVYDATYNAVLSSLPLRLNNHSHLDL